MKRIVQCNVLFDIFSKHHNLALLLLSEYLLIRIKYVLDVIVHSKLSVWRIFPFSQNLISKPIVKSINCYLQVECVENPFERHFHESMKYFWTVILEDQDPHKCPLHVFEF